MSIERISKEQYEAMKANAFEARDERDIEYTFEVLLDKSGNELGFASFHSILPTRYYAYGLYR